MKNWAQVDSYLSYWMKLLAHRHWITLRFFDKKLRLCARCTGIVLGFVSLRVGTILLSLSIVIPSTIGFILAFLFALPSIIDWMTHNLKFRQSKNNLRMLTGFLEGGGIGLLSLTNLSLPLRILTIALIGTSVILIGNSKNILQKPFFKKNTD